MKRKFLTALSITILGVTSYAATFMHVKTKEGYTVKFNIKEVEEVIFEEKSAPADTTLISNHEYVDLGLPSGTLWATCNIGATKPEEYGDYFAWGETASKPYYSPETYKWCTVYSTGDMDSILKYNSIDSITVLAPEDDAATVNWGAEWRIPTPEEQYELIDNCTYSWTEVNGVMGVKFTAQNGNSIFLPAAGRYEESKVLYTHSFGGYWSSSLDSEVAGKYLCLSNDFLGVNADDYGHPLGYTVRAVHAKK